MEKLHVQDEMAYDGQVKLYGLCPLQESVVYDPGVIKAINKMSGIHIICESMQLFQLLFHLPGVKHPLSSQLNQLSHLN